MAAAVASGDDKGDGEEDKDEGGPGDEEDNGGEEVEIDNEDGWIVELLTGYIQIIIDIWLV